MRAHLWTAIHELMDIAEGAAGVLDKYSDYEDGDHGASEPNAALYYRTRLMEAVETLGTHMEIEVPK